MKTWNEEQLVALARRAYERRQDYGLNDQREAMCFRDGIAAMLAAVLSVTVGEAERRLLKPYQNLKESKS